MSQTPPPQHDVHPDRRHTLAPGRQGSGPVVYWMHREQRIADNWGLLLAQDLALQAGRALVCVFCLAPSFPGAGRRQYAFMLAGLKEAAADAAALRIPFVLLRGEPGEELPALVRELDACQVVTDFAPLRVSRSWQLAVCHAVDVPVLEVDGHNIAPCRRIADKQQVGARTLRPKINKRLDEYLEPFPELLPHPHPLGRELAAPDWGELLPWLSPGGPQEVDWITPGGRAARLALDDFLDTRLPRHASQRNDPNAGAVSLLSPYFHFGQLSPQRAALEALGRYGREDENVQAWLEELIVRRELSDNFCHYNEGHDSLEGAPNWALETLDAHRGDPRPYVYGLQEFETAGTHSTLWNAAQRQLLQTGTMHGYMRMYWAKKILEWSESPEQALAMALDLNDRYQLDGRDPNGCVGVLWSVAGLHDRPWKERDVYGKIRYMNANGCRRKFDTAAYIRRHGGDQA